MELSQLRFFVTVAKEENLTRAAQRLHISQSALSTRIKTLEDELQVLLFQRNSRGMRLTDHGRILFTLALDTLATADRLREKANELSGWIRGSLAVGINSDPGSLRLGALNKRLQDLYPGLNVLFLASNSVAATTEGMLKAGTIDIGFHSGPIDNDAVASREIALVDLCVVIPKHLAAGVSTWSEAAALPWVWPTSACPFYGVLSPYFSRHGYAPNQVVAAAEEKIIKELVKDGQGAAVLRLTDGEALEASGHAVLWPGKRMRVSLFLSWLKKRQGEELLDSVTREIAGLWLS